jgi:hypothetical protein
MSLILDPLQIRRRLTRARQKVAGNSIQNMPGLLKTLLAIPGEMKDFHVNWLGS